MSDEKAPAVQISHSDGVAVIIIANPPVNALSAHVKVQLGAALRTIQEEAGIKAVVIGGAGRTFISGADISEFGTEKTLQRPTLPEICKMLETLGIPTVAAIHGQALGGGLELALACHYRVVERRAKLGLPEVKLGLIPGAGGTVRLPRLVGAEKALRMIVTGTPISADEALDCGLADTLADGDVIEAAILFAKSIVEVPTAPLPPVRDRDERLATSRADPATFEVLARDLAKKARHLEAPGACIQAVRNTLALPFDEALRRERELFSQLVTGSQSRALRHLFFAERKAAKLEAATEKIDPRPVERVGVIGAGTMGGGIAMALAGGGIPVTIIDATDEALQRGLALVEKNYDVSIARGSIGRADKEARMALLTASTDYADLAGCDLIIEAVFEDMAVKKDVFARLDAVAKPGAILATNTSYLDVNEIAAGTSRPHDVLGLHFFSPANVMKLLEIVRGARTAIDVLTTALSLAKRIGKIPVVVGVCPGFVGNRMLAARGAQNDELLLEGGTPAQIDRVFTEFGWPMGPFQMSDMAGLDIGWRNRKAVGKTAVVADALCELGRFGQKTAGGFYRYTDGERTPEPDPDVLSLIEQKARERGIARRAISDGEILERTHYPMINEAARIIDEGIAARASDIDVIWTNGYGFPVGKGGPMFWANEHGIERIAETLSHWQARTGQEFLQSAGNIARREKFVL